MKATEALLDFYKSKEVRETRDLRTVVYEVYTILEDLLYDEFNGRHGGLPDIDEVYTAIEKADLMLREIIEKWDREG